MQFQLVCEGCPVNGPQTPPTLKPGHRAPWVCKRCFYVLPDPTTDPFYQEKVKSLMYFCAGVLVFVRPSLLSSSTWITILITSLSPPIVLLDRPLVLASHACFADLAEPPSTDGTQGSPRARTKPFEHLPQTIEHAIRRRAKTAECGDYGWKRARGSPDDRCRRD